MGASLIPAPVVFKTVYLKSNASAINAKPGPLPRQNVIAGISGRPEKTAGSQACYHYKKSLLQVGDRVAFRSGHWGGMVSLRFSNVTNGTHPGGT